MKRLLEEERHDDAQLRQAQQLLAAVEPLDPSQESMWRVRRGMEQKRAERRTGLLGVLRGPRALALTTLLVFGGTALAAAQTGVLRRVIARVTEVIQLAPPPAPAAAPTAPKRARQPLKRQAETPHIEIEVAAPVLAAPAPETTELAAPEPQATELPAAQQPAAGAHHRAEPRRRLWPVPERMDTELVRHAVKALRRDNNPAAAAELLEAAYKRSRDSVLAEEVLSLRVEAALALGDPKARSYAQEYVRQFPQGRYRKQVERALK